jgi:hypothetical protein
MNDQSNLIGCTGSTSVAELYQGSSNTGFSPWVLGLAATKTQRLKPVLLDHSACPVAQPLGVGRLNRWKAGRQALNPAARCLEAYGLNSWEGCALPISSWSTGAAGWYKVAPRGPRSARHDLRSSLRNNPMPRFRGTSALRTSSLCDRPACMAMQGFHVGGFTRGRRAGQPLQSALPFPVRGAG